MPRPPARPCALLVDALDGLADLPERWLIAQDPDEDLPLLLRTMGRRATRWQRHAGQGLTARPEPPAGPFDALALRLPRGREALDLALHLGAARLAPGSPIWLYGGNDEGIRSAGRQLAPLFDAVEVADARRHGRLWTGRRSEAPALGQLGLHRRALTLDLPRGARTLVSYPGCFAKGALDPGSALLLAALDRLDLPPPRRALDFACGVGVLGSGALQRWPDLDLHGCDADAVAVAAASENLPGAQLVVADGLDAFDALPPTRYDLVLSNPPIHVGDTLDLGLLERLVARLPGLLAPGGAALLVVQRQRPVPPLLASAGFTPQLVEDDGRFRVWLAVRAMGETG